MQNFPKEVRHNSGAMAHLDASRLLISFRETVEKSKLEPLLREMKLGFEDQSETKEQRNLPGVEIVNHTDRRFWIKSIDNEPLTDDRYESLKAALGNFPLEFIGPVYKIGQSNDRSDLFCPFPNVLLIRPQPKLGRKLAEIIKPFELTEVAEKSKYLGDFNYYILPSVESKNAYDVLERLNNVKEIAEIYFENMPLISPFSAVPSDPLFPTQWNMTQINAPLGWDITTGAASVVVAVLDSGCDLGHPDLDFVSPGVDLGDMISDGSPNNHGGSTGHGTCCAGIVAARFNNAAGVAGVAGSCRILPIAISSFSDAEIAAGINYAVANGAAAISMSFMMPSSVVMDTAISSASVAGVVMCAATGNGNSSVSNGYPARHPLVMGCGASSTDDNRKSPASPDGEPWGSNYGTNLYLGEQTGVSVVAPGVQIPTTDILGGAGYNAADYHSMFNGTSAATPHVAGLAALIKTQYPALSGAQIRNIIERTADKAGTALYVNTLNKNNGTWNQEMGYGRISVLKALSFADTFIRDYPADTGTEPSNPPGGNFWDFSDIVVRINDDGLFNPSNPAQSKNVEQGQDNFIYVQVTNNGPRDATNVTVNCRITPWVGIHFIYPQDWTLTDAMHVQPAPVIGTFANIPAGGSVLAKFKILAADTNVLYGWQYSNPWHPCLLAEVRADNDYAFATASFAAGDHLSKRFNNLAQRNLSVIDVFLSAEGFQARAFPFVAGSRFDPETHIFLTVDKSRMGKATKVLLSLDDDGSAFPLVNFERTDEQPQDECGGGGMVFLQKTRIETTLGCCRGVLTLEKGSRFDCQPRRNMKILDVKGGEIIVRGGKQYIEIREQKTVIRLEKQPNQQYPLSVQFEIPSTVRKGEELHLVVSQQNHTGETVGGATAIYLIK